MPLAADYRSRNVERQLGDPTSLLNLYRALLAYRRASAALKWGIHRTVDSVPDDCFIFLREADDQRLLVALNFSSSRRTLLLADLGRGEVAISTHLDREGKADMGELALRSGEGVIIEALR